MQEAKRFGCGRRGGSFCLCPKSLHTLSDRTTQLSEAGRRDRTKPTDCRSPLTLLPRPTETRIRATSSCHCSPASRGSVFPHQLWVYSCFRTRTIVCFFFPCLECSSTINSHAVSSFTVSIQCQIPLDLSLWARPLLFLSCPPRFCLSLTPGLIFFKALTLRGLFSCMCISLSHSRHTALKWALCWQDLYVCFVPCPWPPQCFPFRRWCETHHKCTMLSSSLNELSQLSRVHTRRRKAAAVPLLLLLSGRPCTMLFSLWFMDSVPLRLGTAPLHNWFLNWFFNFNKVLVFSFLYF